MTSKIKTPHLCQAGLALFAALAFSVVGCDEANERELEVDVDREVRPIEPEADVEVMPSGEVDVDLAPNVTE